MKILIIAWLGLVSLQAVASEPQVTAEKKNGTVILRVNENNDEKVYVVKEVFQIGGARAPREYEAPFRLQRMIDLPNFEDEDMCSCMPRFFVRGVYNWLSDYVRGELERLFDIRI